MSERGHLLHVPADGADPAAGNDIVEPRRPRLDPAGTADPGRKIENPARPGIAGPPRQVPLADIVVVGRTPPTGGAFPARDRITPLARALMLVLAASIFALGLRASLDAHLPRATTVTEPDNPRSAIG